MTKIRLRGISLSVFFLLIILVTPEISLAFQDEEVINPDIIINELMIYGSSVSGSDEWIELKNLSDEIIDLGGFCLYDDIKQEKITLIEEGQIAPRGYFLISNNGKDHQFKGGSSILDIDPDIVSSKISLSNSKFQISIKDGTGNVLDTAGDGATPFYNKAGDRYYSIERVNLLSGLAEKDWQISTNQENLDQGVPDLATPNNSGRPVIESFDISSEVYFKDKKMKYKVSYLAKNFEKMTVSIANDKLDKEITISDKGTFEINETFCPVLEFKFTSEKLLYSKKVVKLKCFETSKQVFINEVLPHPKKDWNKDGKESSGDEWIEIGNKGKNISIDGWWLEDGAGKKFTIKDIDIDHGKLRTFYKSETKISINDDGDNLYLFDPSGALISKTTVPNSTKYINCSYAKGNNGWAWSSKPTPKSDNVILPVPIDKKKLKKDEEKIDHKQQELTKSEEIISNALPKTSAQEVVRVEMIKKYVTTKKITKAKLALADNNNYYSENIRADFGRKILGAKDRRDEKTSNYLVYMVYFTGLLSFIFMLSIYEICCRE